MLPILCIIKKSESSLNEKDIKVTNWSHTYKSYVSTYDFEILNSFNGELQLKDTKSAIKNKLIDLWPELKEFIFVTTLVLEFKKMRK